MPKFKELLNSLQNWSRIMRRNRLGDGEGVNIYSHEQLSGLAAQILQYATYNASGRITASSLSIKDSYISRLHDYDMEDDYDLISAAFDIYAEEASLQDLKEKRSIWINSENAHIKKLLMAMFDRIELDLHLTEIARTIVKYGNDFERLVIDTRLNRIAALDYLNPYAMRIIDLPERGRYYMFQFTGDLALDRIGTLDFDPITIQNNIESGQRVTDKYVILDGWSVVHFRYRGKYRDDVYGYSLVESARSTWKRLIMLENAMLFKKLQRSISRYIFYVKVGEANVADSIKKLREFSSMIKRSKRLNELIGSVDVKYNQWVDDDDLFIPVRDDKDPTRIETLEGIQYDGHEEVDYYLSKLFTSLKIPKTYLSFEDIAPNRSTLGTEDMRFAKSVITLQQLIMLGVRQMCDVELILHGIDPKTVKYEVEMTQPSAIFELAQLETDKAKIEVAQGYKDFMPRKWILKNIFSMTEKEIDEIEKMRAEEEKAGTGFGQENPLGSPENPMGGSTEGGGSQPTDILGGQGETQPLETTAPGENGENTGNEQPIFGNENGEQYDEIEPTPATLQLAPGVNLNGVAINSKRKKS